MVTYILRTVVLVILAASSAAGATEFTIEPDESNEVVFTSKAPLESFDGRTQMVNGYIVADLSDLSGEVDVRVVVDLASLDTGIGLRNTHMRENHLETDIYPEATFTGGRIVKASVPALEPGQTAKVRLAGALDLHGVTQSLEVESELELSRDGTLRVTTEFPVSLENFSIKRPSFLIMKLADEQKIRISLQAVPAGG